MSFTPMNMSGQYDPSAINFGGAYSGMAGANGLGSALGGDVFGGPGLGSNWLAKSGLGANMDTLKLGLGGLQTLGGLWAAYNAADVARKQLSFTKGVTNANLANQTQSYNTAIADRARARGVTEGQSQSMVDDYIAKNSLAKRTVG